MFPKVYGVPSKVAAFAITVSADGKAAFSVDELAAFAVITPLIDEPNIEKAQSPAMNPALSFFNIFDFLNIKCISPFHFCKEKEPDFGSFVCTF